MKSTGALKFAIIGGVIVVAAGMALLLLTSDRDAFLRGWSILGWSIMAVTGVAGGIWLSRVHGRQGAAFLVALGTCMLARLFASVGGAVGAAISGKHAVWAYLAGLCAGYIPLQSFEVFWFIRKARQRSRSEQVVSSGMAEG